MSVQCTWFWGQFIVARGAGKECLSINQFFFIIKNFRYTQRYNILFIIYPSLCVHYLTSIVTMFLPHLLYCPFLLSLFFSEAFEDPSQTHLMSLHSCKLHYMSLRTLTFVYVTLVVLAHLTQLAAFLVQCDTPS